MKCKHCGEHITWTEYRADTGTWYHTDDGALHCTTTRAEPEEEQ